MKSFYLVRQDSECSLASFPTSIIGEELLCERQSLADDVCRIRAASRAEGRISRTSPWGGGGSALRQTRAFDESASINAASGARAAKDIGVVCIEVAYRPVPEYEGWRADVAYVSKERWYGTPRDGYLQGAPELVIEILSPSNTIPEIREKRKLCLANGSREFWVVDSDDRDVEVWTPNGRSITYRSTDEIPLFFAPGLTLRVGEIFD